MGGGIGHINAVSGTGYIHACCRRVHSDSTSRSRENLHTSGCRFHKNTSLIGQSGGGFYSASMVAKSVKVYWHSRKAAAPGHVWTSTGAGTSIR